MQRYQTQSNAMSLDALLLLSTAAADFNPRVERNFNGGIIAYDIPTYKVDQLQTKIIKLVADESKKQAPLLKTVGFTFPVYTMNTDHRDFNDNRSNVRFLPTYNGPKELPDKLKSKIMDKPALFKWITKHVEESVRDIKKSSSPDQMTAREVTIDKQRFQIRAKYSAYQMVFQIIPRGQKAKSVIAHFMPPTINNVPVTKIPSSNLLYKTTAVGPAFLEAVCNVVETIMNVGRGVEHASVDGQALEKTFIYDYYLNGTHQSFDVVAKTFEEAEEKFKAMCKAWYVGELVLRVPLPV